MNTTNGFIFPTITVLQAKILSQIFGVASPWADHYADIPLILFQIFFILDLQKEVSLGYIWEDPRAEEHDATEVIVDGSRNELRLTCILKPPLPLTKETFLSRDKIVKWIKIEKTHGHQLMNTFWSDGQDVTAISLSKLRLQDLGTYGCTYGSLMKTINITGEESAF